MFPRPKHIRAVGDATRSKRVLGTVCNIAVGDHDPVAFDATTREVGFVGLGFQPRSVSMHIDLAPQASERAASCPARALRRRDPAGAREPRAEPQHEKGGDVSPS
jgi:hypothetical protein